MSRKIIFHPNPQWKQFDFFYSFPGRGIGRKLIYSGSIKRTFVFIFISVMFSAQVAHSQQKFEQRLQKLLSRPGYRNASVGVHVVNANSGKSLFELNSEKLLIPASTLKLATSAAALDILGPDYQFKTPVGYTGAIINDTLKGDLVIIGGGDPALGSEFFKDHYFDPHFLEVWTQYVKKAGIKMVEGRLILDETLYNQEIIPPTWIWEDIGNYYGAGTNALTVYDNLFRITFHSPSLAGFPTDIIAVYPKISGIKLKNEVISSEVNRDLAYVFGSPYDQNRVIRGTIPKNRKAFTIKASNPFPGQLLANHFQQHLRGSCIFISGETRFKKVIPEKFRPVYIQKSPAMNEIIKVLNTNSVNFIAEHLVKQMTAIKTGTGDREQGLELINTFFHNNGIDTSLITMEDGSGLSHFNLASPRFFTSLLCFMFTNDSIGSHFLNSLPLAGEGTLHQFDRKIFPGKTMMAKSGSMKRVRCYAGYLKTDKGKTIAFSLMFNHFKENQVDLVTELEKILTSMKSDF